MGHTSFHPIATYSRGKYMTMVGSNKKIYYKRKDVKDLVYCGKWCGFVEDNWNITQDVYDDLPLTNRAMFEAKEQQKWIKNEFEQLWVKQYETKKYYSLCSIKSGKQFNISIHILFVRRCLHKVI